VAQSEVAQKKMLAGILGIVIGWTGAHRFVLGDTTGGIIRLVISIFTCGVGHIIGLVEGIIYLTKSDDEFQRVYIEGKKAWF
jgi:TM2 domain-containing membrane protein YozV